MATLDETVLSTTSDQRDVLFQAKELQAELERFGEHLANVYDGHLQEFPKQMHAVLYRDVVIEVAKLESHLSSQDPLSPHRVSSSNLPYFHAVWDAAKRFKNIVRLRHPVFSGPFKRRILAPGMRVRGIMSLGGSEPKRNQTSQSFNVDIICDEGLSWYKISTITNRRLLFDIAKEALYCGESDSSDSAGDASQGISDISLVKLAARLKAIAHGHQIRNSSPTPSLILPRIIENEHAEIDRIIKCCRDMGINVLCGNGLAAPSPLSTHLLHEMVPSPKTSITPELNIDTSVLVALASDISHFQVAKQPWSSANQNDHIDLETNKPFLHQLCPLLGHHTLVCTLEAVRAFARIVYTIGTNSEIARAYLLLTPDESLTRERRIDEFRTLSVHGESIPSQFHLPIRIVGSGIEMDEDSNQTNSHSLIDEGLRVLGQPIRSVFSFGWAHGLTTITCNIVAIRHLEKTLEELPLSGVSEWPSVWAFSTSRPLIGVPKESNQQRLRKHIGDCHITCLCGLEELHKR